MPKLALSFMYIESFWVLFDTVFILESVSHQNTLVITARFLAVGIFLGIYERQTIVTVTLLTVMAQILIHKVAYQDEIELRNIMISTIFVFLCVTAHFMSLHQKSKLKQVITNLAEERDEFLRGLPEETQILVINAR